MGFKQYYLNEARFSTYDDLDTFLGLIKKDCKPFLKHKTQIFRGMGEGTYPEMGIRGVRKNRKPKDSSGSEDIVVNGYLRDNKLPLRSSAMFASTDEGQAMVYGDEFLVFPKGNFKSVSFNKIEDVYGDIFSAYAEGGFSTVNDLDDVIDDNAKFLFKEYGKKEITMLAQKSMFDHMAQDIVKGMKVEDAMWVYLDRVEEIFTSIPKWEEEWSSYHSDFSSIPYHAKKFFWDMLDGGYTSNDIAKSNGNEIIIECKDYYFMKTFVEDKKGNKVSAKKLVEKELGLIER